MHDNVLQDGSGRNIDSATLCRNNDDRALQSDASSKVNGTSNGQVVKLNDLRDAADALLEVRDLLEVVSELDKRSWTESIRVNL